MNVRSLLVGLMMLVWGNSLQGQEVSRGRLGILLKSHYTLGMAPTFGWSFPLSSKSYLRLGIGLLFYRAKKSHAGDSYYAGQSYWVTTQRLSDAPFLLDIGYGIAL